MSVLTQRKLRKMANDIEKGKMTEVEENSRRRWLMQAGLTVALALEHEAIAIYTAAAGLPSVTGNATVLDVAGSFLAHHKEHRAALIGAIGELKAQNPEVAVPVTAKAGVQTAHYGVYRAVLLTLGLIPSARFTASAVIFGSLPTA